MDYYNASHTPATKPPSGIISNFVDPPNQRNIVLVYTTLFTVIATLGVTGRLYTRIFVVHKVQLEDYLLATSWGFFMVFNGLVYAQAATSIIGRHAWDVNLIQLQYFLWLSNLTTIVYGPMLICAKGALILLWQRLFAEDADRRALWWFLRALLYVNVAVYICGMAIQTFMCNPREKIWQPWLDGSCLNTEASLLYSAAWNLFLNIILFSIPLFSLRRLNLQKKRKRILMGYFALGIVTCIASVLRIVNAIELVNSSDSVYDQQNSVWAAALEYTGIILIICAPTIPKLWHHLRGKGEKEVVPGGASSRQSADQHSRSRFYPNKTWIELGRTTRSSGLLAGPQNGQKISERDVERDLSYHDVKRSDSIIEPMKVYVRSEFSISVDEAKRRVSDPDINSVGFLRSPSIDKKDVITGYSRHSRK